MNRFAAPIFLLLLLLLIFIVAPTAIHANHAININTADKNALMTLTGIGEVKAQAIIDYRGTNGHFAAKEDIQNVSGIGPATYENIKDHITVSGGGAEQNSESQNATSSQEQTPPPPAQTQTGSASVEPQLVAQAGGDRAVIVGADTLFEGKAFAKDGELMGPLGVRFLWNFGDGKTKEGYKVMHHFTHSGRYVVTLDVNTGSNSATDRTVVTAKPAAFLLSRFSDGSAIIENKTDLELNLSFWFIKSGNNHFALPENTIVLTKEKIIIPPASLGFSIDAEWQLLYPNGEVAEVAPPPKPLVIHTPTTSESQPVASVAKHTPSTVKEEPEKVEKNAGQVAAVETAAPDVTTGSTVEKGWLNVWTIGFIALTIIGAAGVLFASRINRKEWDIQEI